MRTALECPKCRHSIPQDLFDRPELQPCPSCKRPLRAQTFPAFFSEAAAGSVGESLLSEEEAGCFYHPQKRAVVHCEHCGRFLCALCDIELHGEHICAACLEAGKKKGKLKNLENHRTLYDSIAFRVSLYPLLFFFYPTIFGAPAAIFIAIRYWNKPGSLVRRGKGRFVLAIVIALLEIAAWIAIFWSILQFSRAFDVFEGG